MGVLLNENHWIHSCFCIDEACSLRTSQIDAEGYIFSPSLCLPHRSPGLPKSWFHPHMITLHACTGAHTPHVHTTPTHTHTYKPYLSKCKKIILWDRTRYFSWVKKVAGAVQSGGSEANEVDRVRHGPKPSGHSVGVLLALTPALPTCSQGSLAQFLNSCSIAMWRTCSSEVKESFSWTAAVSSSNTSVET